MTIRPILKFPDPRLRTAAAPVPHFDADLQILAADLLDTLRAAPGIGITAPHIGILERLVVIELSATRGPRCYVNPVVVWSSPEVIRHPEGSVSMPGVKEDVERPRRVRVNYHDLDGRPRMEEAEDLLAVCLQHEIDQLDGIFWVRRLSRLKRDRAVRAYEKLLRGS